MAKFAIECPECGKYAQAKTGFFSRKKIDCSCGYVIDVRTDKLSSRQCPHCGNQIVYDRSKGSQEAIFFKDGQALDLFGPGRYTLETHLSMWCKRDNVRST